MHRTLLFLSFALLTHGYNQVGKDMRVVRRGDDRGGVFSLFKGTRLRSIETGEFEGTAVYDGELVERLGDEEEIDGASFSRVKTSGGKMGLVRSAYLRSPPEYVEPWYVQALEKQAERSALRREQAKAASSLDFKKLREALLPLELVLGAGALVDPESDAITSRGWAAVGLAVGAPSYLASVLSNVLSAGLRVATSTASPRQQL